MKTTTKLHKTLLGTGGVLLVLAGPVLMAQTPHLTRVLAQLPASSNPQPPSPPETFAPEPPQKETIVGPRVTDSLFAGTEKFAKGASNVTEVNMGPQSLDLVQGNDAKRAHRTILSEVRTYTYDKPGMYNPADLDEFRQRLETADWQCSVHTRDLKNGTSTDICSRRRAPDLIERAIITAEPKQLTFVHNIRKTDGEGGRLDDQGLELFLPGVPSALAMAGESPELEADLVAAQMRAQVAALSAAQVEVPALNQRDLQLQMRQLQEQMKHLPAPSLPDADQLNHLNKQLQSLPEGVHLLPLQMAALQQQLQQLQQSVESQGD